MKKFFLGILIVLTLGIGMFGFIENRTDNNYLVEDAVDAGPQSEPPPSNNYLAYDPVDGGPQSPPPPPSEITV